MKIVDIADFARNSSALLDEVERGADILLVRDSEAVIRLSKANSTDFFQRTPGIAADHPSWRDFHFDPSIFAPLETDEELRAEGWEA